MDDAQPSAVLTTAVRPERGRTAAWSRGATSQLQGRARSSVGDLAAPGATSQLQGRRRSSRGDLAAPGATGADATWRANVLRCRIEWLRPFATEVLIRWQPPPARFR